MKIKIYLRMSNEVEMFSRIFEWELYWVIIFKMTSDKVRKCKID